MDYKNIGNIDNDRIIGIELLRCISMFMIIMLHYLANGEALYKTTIFTANYYIVWLLEAFCYVAVNCYILISGYFLVKSKFKLEKLIKLWLEVILYSVVIYIVLSIFGVIRFNKLELIKSCFPIILSKYWFATCYLGLYLLFPYINVLINSMNKTQMKKLLFILILIFSVWKTFIPFAYTLNPGGGSNIIWFIVLYLCGAYIKLYYKENNSKYTFWWYIVLSCCVAISKFLFQFIFKYIGMEGYGGALFYHYDSLPILLSSIMLFLSFKDIDIKDRYLTRIIKTIGSLTFGIYLIHNNGYLNNVLWINILKVDFFINSKHFLIITLLYVLSIYFICCLLDYVRLKIFKKCKLDNLILRICDIKKTSNDEG